MSVVPRLLCLYILAIGCCFFITEAQLFSFNNMMNASLKSELDLVQKIAALKSAFAKTKDHFFPEQDPEEHMNASELITSKGYPCERHSVLTDDGFILGLQRIPYGLKNKNITKQRPIAYLQHGLLGSSTNFLTNLANESLAFVLADAGFDVWLGNSRGNTYSRRHVKYSTKSRKFWEWSFDEMAKYDLPASLNYVTKYTRQEKLYYVGHSQGTLIGFMAFSQNEKLAKKIRLMVAMGPVLTVAHMSSPIKFLTRFTDKEMFFLFGRKVFLSDLGIIKLMANTVCKNPESRFLCMDVMQLIAGSNQKHLNESRLPVYFTHCPAGTSVRNMVHFAQNYRTKLCSKFDFGSKKENILHYGQPTPPAYDVTGMDVPVALYSGDKDPLADPRDVKWLSKQLKNVVMNKSIKGWAHLEFMWGVDAPQGLYYDMIKFMRKF